MQVLINPSACATDDVSLYYSKRPVNKGECIKLTLFCHVYFLSANCFLEEKVRRPALDIVLSNRPQR